MGADIRPRECGGFKVDDLIQTAIALAFHAHSNPFVEASPKKRLRVAAVDGGEAERLDGNHRRQA